VPLKQTKRRVIPYTGRVRGLSTQEDFLAVPPYYRKTDTPVNYSVKSLNGSQMTETWSHPDWRSHKQGVYKGDIGGPFYTNKIYAVGTPIDVTLQGDNFAGSLPYQRYTYVGAIWPLSPSLALFPTSLESTEKQLVAFGTQAIARCSPANPTASVTTFLGELVGEGIPKLIGSGLEGFARMSNRQRRKALAKEHLNYQFGWLPFVSDLRSMANAVIHANKILKDFERGSGRITRRKYSFPPSLKTISIVDYPNANPYGPGAGALYTSPPVSGQVVRTEVQRVNRWFSGAFTYYVPPPDGVRNRIARAVIQSRKLLGLDLTPDSLWNLAPWSWLVDWFTDTGSVIQNWSDWAIDNQVMLYGYMMEHSVHSYTYTYVGKTGFKSEGRRPADLTTVNETKRRIQASPYGFGLTYDSLSDRQKSILAALGISKTH